MVKNRIKTLYKRAGHAVFLAFLCFLISHPAAAGLSAQSCFNAFGKISGYWNKPSAVREAQNVAGLSDREIEGSIIVDAGGAHSTEFVIYAKEEMGAEEALILNIFPAVEAPEEYLMRTHPLLTMKNKYGNVMFNPDHVYQRLGNRFADITLSLFKFGKFNRADTRVWLESLIKITKPGGLIILDFGKDILPLRESQKEVTVAEFKDILSQMMASGAISNWSKQHVNRPLGMGFHSVVTSSIPVPRSVTYRIVTAAKPSNSPDKAH